MGVVTTTRVQHASPAGTYAHTVNRNWYSDADVPAAALEEGCRDIAAQLISNVDIDVRREGPRGPGGGLGPSLRSVPGNAQSEPWGQLGVWALGGCRGYIIRATPQTWWGTRGLSERAAKGLPGPKPTGPHALAQVILGGGRQYMFPNGTPDPEYPDDATRSGVRLDGRNLVQEWQAKRQVRGVPGAGAEQGQGQGCRPRDGGGLRLGPPPTPPGCPVRVEPNGAPPGVPGPLGDAPHG